MAPASTRGVGGGAGIVRSAALIVAVSSALVTSACGDDGPPLSAAGQQGREVAADKGCQSCHGNQGQGGVGPSWQGLAGAEVELDDGTVVVADERYLRESIVEPDAAQVAGYRVSMPYVDLEPSEVDSLIAYIQDLKDVP